MHYIAFYSPKNQFFLPKQTLKKLPRMTNSYFFAHFTFIYSQQRKDEVFLQPKLQGGSLSSSASSVEWTCFMCYQ